MKPSAFLASCFALLLHAALSAQQFAPDPDFGINGKTTVDFSGNNDAINAIALQPDGKIIASGLAHNGSNFDFALTRFTANGQPDASFGSNGKVVTPLTAGPDRAQALAIQADGKIVLAGFVQGAGEWDFAVARYLADGSLDTGFGFNGIQTTDFGGTEDYAYALGLQPDGKIVIGGYTTTLGSSAGDFALARYTTEGVLDSSFGVAGKAVYGALSSNDRISALLIQPEGKIVATGWSDALDPGNSFNTFAVLRCLPDGALDTSFGAGGVTITSFGAAFNLAYTIALQADGKILVGGSSNNGSYNNIALARYLEDGTLDSDFNGSGIFIASLASRSEASAIALQPDGKIVVGGTYGLYPAEDCALIRISPDGTPDEGFAADGLLKTDIAFSDDGIYALALQPDGKIVAGGFTSSISQSDFALLRYAEDTGGSTGAQNASTLRKTASVTPNPVLQQAVLHYELSEDAVVTIQLLNAEGVVLMSFVGNEKQREGNHETPLNLPAELPGGVYQIVVCALGERVALKIVK